MRASKWMTGVLAIGLIFGLIENGAYVLFAQIPGVAPFSMTVSLAFWMLFALLLFKPTGLLVK